MVWSSSPRVGRKKEEPSGRGAGGMWGASSPSSSSQLQQMLPPSLPYAGSVRSPFSSNNSGSTSATDHQRALDMDPEAVSHVWIPDRQDVWRLARLERLSKECATVYIPGICEESFEVPRSQTRAWDPSHSLYLEDAAKLNSLHEAALLSLLHTRFVNDDIYTYTGDVLISVNPYKTIPLLYSMPHDNSDAINRRITGGVGRLSDVERICADGAEDSDCDDGAALDYRNGRGFGRSISNVSGGGGVGASYYGGGGGPAGGTNHGGIKKSSFRSDSSRGSAARSNGVRFSNGSSAVGPAAGEDGVGRKPPKKKNDSVLDHPHVYAVADKAHRFMTDPSAGRLSGGVAGSRKRDQSIIITGESGAGKTEAAKYVMKYLIAASRAVAPEGESFNKNTRKNAKDTAGDMEKCLMESTVILEAFGNAKTVRNDNSSRFGKYIKLQYGSDWRLAGARTLPFLLEKSRLVHQELNERNYHVFYQMCKGVPEDLCQSLYVGDAPEFEMLRKGGVFMQSDEVDDAEEFRSLTTALFTLGVTNTEQEGLWRLLSALLHLGNIRFIETEAPAGGTGDSQGPGLRLESPLVEVEEVARMAGLPADRLVSSMRKKVAMTGRGSFLEIPLNPTQASDNRNGLVKHIYGQIFTWLVGKVNEAHGAGHGAETVAFVGILDIFGFEIMVRNSFEQLCINFANEVLQQQFNSHVFVLEQAEYEQEGLDWTMIEFKDNQPVIDLVSKKPRGLLVQLEEQGLLGRRANNKALLQLYHNTHLGKSACYSKPRFDSTEFIILHFAGQVAYDIEGFLEKNNDSLNDNLLDLLAATVDPFLKTVVEFVDPEAGSEKTLCHSAAPFGNPLSPVVSPLRNPLSPGVSPVRSPGVTPPYNSTGHTPPGSGSNGASPGHHATYGSKTSGSLFSSRGGVANGGSPTTFNSGPSLLSPYRNGRPDSRKWRSGGAGPSQMSNAVTVSKAFRGQLQSLMATLRATEPHYIKCIKPNNVKAPGGFSSHLVHQQLNYSGVLEVVRIRREAYPGRIPFLEFFERFELLQRQLVQASTAGKETLALPHPAHATEAEAKEGCRSILESFLPAKFYQIGHTRVFLKEQGQDMLRGALRGVYHRKAALIQACVRAMQGWAKLKEKKAAAIIIHAAARMYLLRRRFKNMISKVLLLQRWYRSRSVRHKYKGCIASAVMIQKRVRGMQARQYRFLQEIAAIIIQRHVRGMAGRRRAGLMLMDLWMEEEENRRREEEFQRRRQNRAAAILRMWVRRMAAKYGLKAQNVAAMRIQRAWLRRARNRWLEERVGRVFAMARAGDVDGMTRELRADPDVLFMRDRKDRFKTLLHLAATSGSTSLVSLLDPLPDDVLALDGDGCTPLHHAAASCKYDVVKFLASRANGRVHVPQRIKTNSVDAYMQETRATKRISMRIIQEARQRTGRTTVRTGGVMGKVAGGAATMRGLANRTNDDVIPAMTASKPVFQGFLMKRRETGTWQKRWCVLTERDMEYYHSRQDHVKGKRPSKAVALSSALLKRSGPPPALSSRPGGESGGIGVGSLSLGPTSISGGFGSNSSGGTGGFGNNSGASTPKSPKLGTASVWGATAGAFSNGFNGKANGNVNGKKYKTKEKEKEKGKDKAEADLAHCFELHSGKLLGDKRNREGRLYFKASGEEELYAWLVPLRVLVGSHNLVRTGAAGILCYVDVARRTELVNRRNKAEQTPLHYSAKGEGRAERDAIGRVQIAAWLVEHGSDPNAADNRGTTPLHAAVERGHVPLAAALVRRGANVQLRDDLGRSPLDLVKRDQDIEDIAVGHFKLAERNPLLAPPVKLSSLTYLSFHLERLVMHNTSDLHSPFIAISVHDSRGRKVEACQDACAPVVRRPNYLWWSASYHMQNPVENLEPGTRLVFSLKDQSSEFVQTGMRGAPGGDGVRELGWGMIHVSKNTMNSQEVSMEMYESPVDLSKKALSPIDLFLSGYVTLTTAQEDMDAIARNA
ncbi:unnamed protein product [Ascophyllum nodosum]